MKNYFWGFAWGKVNIHNLAVKNKFWRTEYHFMGEIGRNNDKICLKWAFLPPGLSIFTLVVLFSSQHCQFNLSEYIIRK